MTPPEGKHSPLPWTFKELYPADREALLQFGDRSLQMSVTDAKFACTAVNLHAKLVEALDKTVCAIADITTSKDFDCGNTKTYLNNIYGELRALLKEAKK